ncbi:hypothetical protein [Cognatilysobacter segetis]|uniref:COG4705 family protein n=1 Tax=Cognatilysobacter segetis TaxID=2492394 RepID=UPI00105C9458|nr:hypothetical protein [Lysobacter segetis]
MNRNIEEALSKVPAITLGFWIIKILATTLGEIGGDAVTMSWLGETTPNAGASGVSGYLIGTGIFAVVFAAAVALQIRARRFNPWMYWTTIVASTTVGTTLADFTTRSLGIGYTGGSTLLLGLLLASLFTWHRTTGTISVDSVRDARSELFYWLTITFSQTLGTALGDWVADTQGLGYVGGIWIFGGLLALVAVLYFTTKISRTALFWAAFVLTRPLGAVIGDFLDKPHAKGGLELSRYTGSIALLVAIALCIALFPQRPATRAH